MALKQSASAHGLETATCSDFKTVLGEFTAAWKQGRGPIVEGYLDRLDPADSQAAVELIYREFCLSEYDWRDRDVDHFISRFPQHKTALERLIKVHLECSPSLLDRWMRTAPAFDALPEAGDEVGPFKLRRELGRGGIARVFLAEQTDLDDRLVVVKVSTTMTREPWLLARVRHPHIVEIVSHARADDDDFQLICMPFWGGATLSAVLEARRVKGRAPVSGLDLLADLDSVAAPEFPTVLAVRPTRELLRGLSYGQTIAWIGARLAEALDHAYTCGVAHGDVKPSNILLSADGNPLLLDFNLAREPSVGGSGQPIGDCGGTIAYMAPERLRRLAADDLARGASQSNSPRAKPGRNREREPHARTFWGTNHDERFRGPHQADIYAMGVVLLEALTGRSPEADAGSAVAVPDTDRFGVRPSASQYANTRLKGANTTLRWAETAGSKTIAPGLRAILNRCLDPDPGLRYRRGMELAEDLDRWRAGRPLLFASEPFWGHTVPRLLRRSRGPMLTACLSLAIILATAAVALVKSEHTLRALSLHKLGRLWDDPESRSHRFSRTNSPQLLQPDEAHIETAARALKEYDVLGPNDWHQRDDVRALPKAMRDDLEVWMLEQVYVYCRALADRPNSPKDWSRALVLLDRISAAGRVPAFAALGNSLNAKLGIVMNHWSSAETGRSDPARHLWVNEYLLGIVAECELDADDRDTLVADERPGDGKSTTEGADQSRKDRTQLAAKRALERYNKFLAIRPDSYWGHYRAAAVSYGLGGTKNFAAAAGHLNRCLERRPNNSLLHGHLAASLMALNQQREAQREIEIAIERAPDLAEFYRTRARIRTTLGETGGLADDLDHFELLKNLLPRVRLVQHSTGFEGFDPPPARGTSRFASLLPLRGGRSSEPSIAEIQPEELVDRADLARAIRHAGEPELAKAELGKILSLDPGQISVRLTRAAQAIEAKRFDDAFADIKTILHDPKLVEHTRRELAMIANSSQPTHPSIVNVLQAASYHFCDAGRIEESKAIARRALDLAIALDQPKGDCHFGLARTLAVASHGEGIEMKEAADHLYHAFVAHPLFRNKYEKDRAFMAVRPSLDELLTKKPDPTVEHTRRLAAMSSPNER